jgi:hypothetical protein
MYEYIAVLVAEDGSFYSGPEWFDFKADAKAYADAHPQNNGRTWIFFECRQVVFWGDHELPTTSSDYGGPH